MRPYTIPGPIRPEVVTATGVGLADDDSNRIECGVRRLFLAALVLPPIFAACAARAAPEIDSACAVAECSAGRQLHRRHASYLRATGHPRSALVMLKSKHLADGPTAAQLYAGSGLLTQAAIALRGREQKDASVPAWLALADAQYKTRQWQDAEQSLRRIPEFLPQPLDRQKTSLLARSLLRQDRNEAAAQVLHAARGRAPLTGVDQYNLGIAWLRSGDAARGAGVLESLGHYQGGQTRAQALADQANLTLGYWFLRQHRGGLARAAFSRIRLHGPLADNGKVGIGWAELATGGGLQRLSETDPGGCAGPQPRYWGQSGSLPILLPRRCSNSPAGIGDDVLAGEPSRADRQSALRRAAVAWQSAARSSDLSPVVQEALVVLPYALDEIGEHARARTAYHSAIQRLELAAARLAAQMTTIRSDRDGGLDTAKNDSFERAGDWSLGPGELERLRAMLQQMVEAQKSLQRQRKKLRGIVHTDGRARIIGKVLDELRRRAPATRAYASPNPAQRGLMLMALSSGCASITQNEQATALRKRLQDLERRIDGFEKQLAAAHTERELEIVTASYEFSRKRLREAYAGLADTGE